MDNMQFLKKYIGMPSNIFSPIWDMEKLKKYRNSWISIMETYRLHLANLNNEAINNLLQLFRYSESDPRIEPMLSKILIKIDPSIKATAAIDYYNKAKKLQIPKTILESEYLYKFSIMLNPNLYEAHCNLGILFAQTNRFDQAVTYLKKSIQIDPERPEAYFNLGLIYYQEKNLSEAKKEWEHVKSIKPDYPGLSEYLDKLK